MSGIEVLCTLSYGRGDIALWGLRVLPDKLWCYKGIACRKSVIL